MSTTKAERVFGELVGDTGYVRQIMRERLDQYDLEELLFMMGEEINRMNKSEVEPEEIYDPAKENVSALTDNILI